MRNDLLILVGAGASTGISTELLTADLIAWRGLVEPARNADDPEALPFFRWLRDVSDEVYPHDIVPFGIQAPVDEPNFEDLIHTAERLSYLLWEPYYDLGKRPPPFESPFYDLSELGCLLKHHGPMSLYDIVIRASNHILDVVAEIASTNPDTEASELVSAARRKLRPKVFSLNYDSRVVDHRQDWWTGFRTLDAAEARLHDEKGGVQLFEPRAAIPDNADAFIQMHGSTHFGWIAHYPAPRYAISRLATPQLTRGTPRREGFAMWNDRTALPVLPMITGFRKGEKVLVEPYASYFHYFRDIAFKTPRWLILGYGGCDPHINAVLTSAADHWGSELRCYVCNCMDTGDWTDRNALQRELKPRLSYLGRVFYRGAFDPEDLVEGEYHHSESIRVSVDGRFRVHERSIVDFVA